MTVSKTRIAAAALALISSAGAITLLAAPAAASDPPICNNIQCDGLSCSSSSGYNCDSDVPNNYCVTSKCK